MIEEIAIRNLGVITEATLPLGPGLSVVTGETGAGKTMVVTALGLLLGARAEAATVRHGAKAASVEAVVHVPENSAAAFTAREAGGELDVHESGAELLLVRTVSSDGRSRAHVGGRSAPIAVLSEIGSSLVTVHGQSDQLRLKSASAQREALDSFAGPALHRLLTDYQELFERFSAHQREREELVAQAEARESEARSLSAALEEIAAVDPQPHEDEDLKVESLRLGSIEELRNASAIAHQAITGESEGGDAFAADAFGEQGAVPFLERAKRELEGVAAKDQTLKSVVERLADLEYQLNDLGNELASYSASLDEESPALLEQVENRRGELGRLLRKYAPSVDELLVWAGRAQEKVETLSQDGTRIQELTESIELEEETLVGWAATLSEMRQAAAATLTERVGHELSALAMPQARLQIEIEQVERLGKTGQDRIQILLQPHSGAPARPLAKGASGGELSRVMLALEVVLAESNPVPTFVFDEVDAGVGGKAAVEIGRRLARLASSVQVLVVTHLPQVAAFADQHIRVYKELGTDPVGGDGASTDENTDTGALTSSDVRVLDEAQRVVELARMLAGQEHSDAARAHAEELLAEAKKHK